MAHVLNDRHTHSSFNQFVHKNETKTGGGDYLAYSNPDAALTAHVQPVQCNLHPIV